MKPKPQRRRNRKKKKEREDKKMGEEMRKKAMEGLVSSECATFFCMILTNMPFGLQLHFTGCIESGLIIYFPLVPFTGMIEQKSRPFQYFLVGKNP